MSEAPRKGPVLVGQRELWVAVAAIRKTALIWKERICFSAGIEQNKRYEDIKYF